MEKFFSAFVKNDDGSWFCVSGAQFLLPGETEPINVTPGVTYRRGRLVHGIDLARWLDDWHQHGARPPGVSFL